MNVLAAAWIGAGCPVTSRATSVGSCARCATVADLVPAAAVVSRTFTAYDTWIQPGGRGLCVVCAWGYTTVSLRAVAHEVTRRPPTIRELSRTAANDILKAGPLGHDRAITVPLRPGRKHIVPSAAWGRVNTDDAQLPWTADDAHRLRLVDELRGHGFGSRMLAAPAPAYQVMKAIAPAHWEQILHAWASLNPWRAPESPWLPLALNVSTPTRSTEDR